MNERLRDVFLIAAAAAAGLAGGLAGRWLAPVPARPGPSQEPPRPIIQLARPAPGIPSLADTIVTVCPSVAAIIPSGSAPTQDASKASAPALVVSADGWVMTSTASLPTGAVDALFASGARSGLTDLRSDPVSGIAILKSSATGLTPIGWSDQVMPRVGDFAFAVQNPNGSGCMAEAALVASDFLADGGGPAAYLRLNPMGPDLVPGTAVLSSDGRAIGIASANSPANSIIAAALVSNILDELLRNDLSPTAAFGFRALDFDQNLASRLGNPRAHGAGIALVQPKSAAARAGLQAGDVVLAVDGGPVASASELGRALDGASKSASPAIARGDQQLTITVVRTMGG